MTTDEVDVFLDQLEAWVWTHPAGNPRQVRAREARAKSLTAAQRWVLGQIMEARSALAILTRTPMNLDLPEITDELADWLLETEPLWRPAARAKVRA